MIVEEISFLLLYGMMWLHVEQYAKNFKDFGEIL